MATLQFYGDPAAFLARAGEHLARSPVLSTVVATVATQRAAEDAAGVLPAPGIPRWWATAVDDAGRVCGAAMRTATGAPYPLFVLPMPEEAAVRLARTLHERGEETTAVNGVLPATRLVAEELARLTERKVRVSMHSRLFELGELRPARPVPGRLRIAEPADLDLCLAWFAAFHGDADEQAGRPRGSSPEIAVYTPADMLRRIEGGRVWLWTTQEEAVVHLTAANAPSFGVSRIGPVYTPPEHRGRGYASAAVAEVTARIQASGARACLFTDQANPTSNAIYQRLGYEPVGDTVALEVA